MNTLEKLLADVFESALKGKFQGTEIQAASPWDFSVDFVYSNFGHFTIRNIGESDERNLRQFGDTLGKTSKELFQPYPWDKPEELLESFRDAIARSIKRADAYYLLFWNEKPIGNFFLWGVSGAPNFTQPDSVRIPELGVAIADGWQHKGLGELSVRILQAVGGSLGADAVKLETAMENASGWNTYLKCGFEYAGIFRVPLGVNIAAAEAGEATAERFRNERQMVYIINPEKRDAVLGYLKLKRIESGAESG